MPETVTLTAWTKPRPSAADVARFLGAWLRSLVTGAPMEQFDAKTLWTGTLTHTPQAEGE